MTISEKNAKIRELETELAVAKEAITRQEKNLEIAQGIIGSIDQIIKEQAERFHTELQKKEREFEQVIISRETAFLNTLASANSIIKRLVDEKTELKNEKKELERVIGAIQTAVEPSFKRRRIEMPPSPHFISIASQSPASLLVTPTLTPRSTSATITSSLVLNETGSETPAPAVSDSTTSTLVLSEIGNEMHTPTTPNKEGESTVLNFLSLNGPYLTNDTSGT